MTTPARPENPYLPLNEWIEVMTHISDDGKELITNFSQVPPNLHNMFHNAVLLVTIELRELTEEQKLAYREIVVKYKPSLVANFDNHFNFKVSKI